MRKNIIFIILIIFLITSGIAIAEEIPIYKGLIHGDELFKNISYLDIENSPYKNEITRLSALGIIQGRNEGVFDPERNSTRDETLFFLVRLLNQEEAAQKAGEAVVINPDDKENKQYLPTQYWAEGYIQVAKDLNIITPEETDLYLDFSDAVKNDIDREIQSKIRRYERSGKYTEQELQNIEDQIRRGLEWNEAYNKEVTREEFATWLSRAMKLEPIYAKEQQTIRNLKDFQTIKTVFLPYIESIYQKGIMNGFDDLTFRPSDKIKREQVAKVIDKVKDEILKEQGYDISYGYVQDIEKNNIYVDHLDGEKEIFLIKDEAGIIVRWDVRNNNRPEDKRDFIVLRNDELGLSNNVNINDFYKYYISPDKEIVYAETPNEPQIVTGKIFKLYEIEDEDIKTPYIQIVTDNGNKVDYLVSSFAHIRVNDKYGNYEDLINDLDVRIKHFGGIAEEILASVEIENPDYILPFSRVYIGKLLSFNDSFFEIITDEGLKTFDISMETNLLKNDRNISYKDFRDGDLLRVEFSEINKEIPDRIIVLDQTKDMDYFYKGTLDRVDINSKSILVSDIEPYDYLGYGSKILMDDYKLRRDAEYQTINKNIDLDYLKNYQGKEIYFWTDTYYGKEMIQSVVIKEGFERSYLDDVKQISFGKKTINLSDVQLSYGDSSLFVKEGRIIDPRVIKEGDEIYVLSHSKDYISLASVESMPIPNYSVFRGKLSDISTYKIKMLNDLYGLLKLKNNSWEKVKGFIEYPMSNETIIWDKRNYNSEKIEVKKFLEEKYLKTISGTYINSSAYIVVYKDEIIGMQLVDESTVTAQFGIGSIKEIDSATGAVKLEKIQNWNAFSKSFISQNTTIDLKLDQSILAKDGRVISLDELNTGDKIYFSRKDNNVYYAMVY